MCDGVCFFLFFFFKIFFQRVLFKGKTEFPTGPQRARPGRHKGEPTKPPRDKKGQRQACERGKNELPPNTGENEPKTTEKISKKDFGKTVKNLKTPNRRQQRWSHSVGTQTERKTVKLL